MEKINYPDVLAERYATAPMVFIWGPVQKVILERELWISALEAQRSLGGNIPEEAINDYRKVKAEVNLESIKAREKITRHDVTARVNEFNELAGRDLCHRGFTSRDETDNVEQLQVYKSLKHVRNQGVAVLRRFSDKAVKYADIKMCGRSHNVPGQLIVLGKRFANWAEEFLIAYERLEHLMENYPLRGIKGPMGTQEDIIYLLGDAEKAQAFEESVRIDLGFEKTFDSVGQVYPRSLDFEVISTLVQLGSGLGNFATTLRLMAGNELAHEGFKEGQDGSSAMPHKINSRTLERICGLLDVLCGFQDMASRLVGHQWNEGDVSCSVVRRVALPGSFFALDGIFESAMTILDEMAVFPGMIGAEIERFQPFLGTSRLISEAIKAGMGRKEAHALIKKHATAAVQNIRMGRENTFIKNLSEDPLFSVHIGNIRKAIYEHGPGNSARQIDAVVEKINKITARHPAAAAYNPEPIL